MRLLPATLPLLLAIAATPAMAAEKGMPQLDFANPLTISQIVWLAVIFLAMYALLSTWALPQVGNVLRDRSSRIASDLDTARAAKDEADAKLSAALLAARDADARAQAEIAAAIAAAKSAAEARAATQNAALSEKLAAAEQTIADARTKAMHSLHDVAASVASTMAERLSGQGIDPAIIRAEVEAASARAANA